MRVSTSTTFIVTLALIASTTHSAKFPSKWKKCPKTNNEECLNTAVPEVLEDLKNGNKPLGVLPLDPLHFTRMEINQGGNSPVTINLTFHDFNLIGASRISLRKSKADWDNFEIEFDADVENGPGAIIGDYEIDGKVLVLPIRGKGKSNITFNDLNIKFKIKGSEQEKNNKKYFHADDVAFLIYPKKTDFYFGNLFDGVPNLGDNMNKFLNENGKEILDSLRDAISAAVGLALKEISNNVFSKIPLDQLYLP